MKSPTQDAFKKKSPGPLEQGGSKSPQNLLSSPSRESPGSVGLLKKLFYSRGKILSREHIHFILGISGGDCSGKKQLINEMFLSDEEGSWLPDHKNPKIRNAVTIIQQDYFLQDKSNKFNSRGINWVEFERAILTVLAGNSYKIVNAKQKGITIELKPNKLLVIQGNHIFMDKLPIQSYLDCKVFIDSDSDVRLSRRIYKDTQDDGVDLNDSINNYLLNIKPSYEQEIEPCKITSDIIIPHFGGGYNDHRRRDEKASYNTNISNAKGLIVARIREEMLRNGEEYVLTEEKDTEN